MLGVSIQEHQQLVDKCRVLIVYLSRQQVEAVEQDDVQNPLPCLHPLTVQFPEPPMLELCRLIKRRNVVPFRLQLGR